MNFSRNLMLILLSLSTKAYAVYGMPEPLPVLNLNKDSVTVSGISSGAFMAVQMGIAYSSEFSGVAAVAGGTYACANGNIDQAKACMTRPENVDIQASLQKVTDAASKGSIDNPESVRKQKIYILQGTEDIVVGPAAGPKLQEFYEHLGAKPVTNFTLKVGHGFPAMQGPSLCRMSRSPWVNDCDFDGAAEIFKTLYGAKIPPVKVAQGLLIRVRQSDFGAEEAQMLDYGHLYIPKLCQDGKKQCKLHVALHGCLQSPAKVGTDFVQRAGYNYVAESNNIVVLYPAAGSSAKNPAGCWDWFGYTGDDYALRTGKQPQVLMKMIDRLTGR